MRSLYALLTTFERSGANALVAFGEAAMQKGPRQIMLSGRGVKVDLPQAPVDFFDRRVQTLIDRFVVGLAADIGAIEFLAVQQHNDRVFKLHSRHFARER